MWNKKYIQDSSEQLNLVVGFLKGMGRFVQGVLDYRDLNYREFAMPGLIKYSIYSIIPQLSGFLFWDSSWKIIGISIIGELFLDPVISIIEYSLYT